MSLHVVICWFMYSGIVKQVESPFGCVANNPPPNHHPTMPPPLLTFLCPIYASHALFWLAKVPHQSANHNYCVAKPHLHIMLPATANHIAVLQSNLHEIPILFPSTHFNFVTPPKNRRNSWHLATQQRITLYKFYERDFALYHQISSTNDINNFI